MSVFHFVMREIDLTLAVTSRVTIDDEARCASLQLPVSKRETPSGLYLHSQLQLWRTCPHHAVLANRALLRVHYFTRSRTTWHSSLRARDAQLTRLWSSSSSSTRSGRAVGVALAQRGMSSRGSLASRHWSPLTCNPWCRRGKIMVLARDRARCPVTQLFR